MYNEVKTSFRKHFDFILLDVLSMELSFFIAYFLRHGSFVFTNTKDHLTILIILIFANLATSYVFNSMQDVLKRPFQIELYATFKQCFLTWTILLIFVFITKTSEEYSRNVFITFPIIYFILALIIRLIYKRFLKKRFANIKTREFLIISTSDREEEIKNRHDTKVNDFNIKKFFFVDQNETNDSRLNLDNIYKYILENHIDEVLICINGKNQLKRELLENLNAMGVPTHIEIDYIDSAIGSNNKEFIEHICDYTVLTCSVSTASTLQLIIKRIVDILSGIIGSIFTLFFAIIIGPIIKIKSPGPIFFKQERVGKNGKTFFIYKFRSMKINAEAEKAKLANQNNLDTDKMFKLENDPRIIPGIGNFIRNTSIDEFPQFINVLKGDMSLVGTRPPTLDEWEKYEPHHRARMTIKPGITGLWQVSGRSNITDFEEVVRLDTEYIKNFSIWLDIAIILKTFAVVFKKVGAK